MDGSVSPALWALCERYAERAIKWADEHAELVAEIYRNDRPLAVAIAAAFAETGAEDCVSDDEACGISPGVATAVVRGHVIVKVIRHMEKDLAGARRR